MKIYILVGTRPNFIKVTQFRKASQKLYPNSEIQIIHTGQHYDRSMSEIFFEQFKLSPDHFLGSQGESPMSLICNIQLDLEKLFNKIGKPDILIVPGDVNSTLAGGIVANKMGIPLAHLEAGLRSHDREMPEEHNRLVVDTLADHLFVTEQSGLDNLKHEDKKGKVHFVGNTMIDTLIAFEPEIDKSSVLEDLGVEKNQYAVVTIHRPSNVDEKEQLTTLLNIFENVAEKHKVIFPAHPRTIKNIAALGLTDRFEKLNLINPGPLGYFEFQKLIKHCAFVLTDSGGIQEETTYRQVPCLTVRENTERPSTISIGTNKLMPLNYEQIIAEVKQIENGTYKSGSIPELWDGRATERILESIHKEL